MASKRFLIVEELSSAARMPLPGATRACAVVAKSCTRSPIGTLPRITESDSGLRAGLAAGMTNSRAFLPLTFGSIRPSLAAPNGQLFFPRGPNAIRRNHLFLLYLELGTLERLTPC